MATFEVQAGGKTFEVDAPDVMRAVSTARLFVARQRMTDAVTARAMQSRNPAASGDESYPRLPLGLALDPSTTEGKINLGMLMTAGAAPVVSSFIAAPMATATTIGTGLVGSELGSRGGRSLGHTAETLGAPKGTAEVLSGVGSLVGGVGAGVGGLKALSAIRSATAGPLERVALEALASRTVAQEAPVAAEAVAPAAAKSWRDVGIANFYGKTGLPTDAEWAKMGGETAKRAWMESRALIPGATTPSDVVAAVKRGATMEELQALYPPEQAFAKAGGQVGATGTSVTKTGAAAIETPPGYFKPVRPITPDPIPQWTYDNSLEAQALRKSKAGAARMHQSRVRQAEVNREDRAVVQTALEDEKAAAAGTGAARAARHNEVMAFAKEAAKKAKLGEKIWMELDEAGKPLRVLTSDEAAAAARAGKATTWVKNLWNAA